MKVAIVCGAPSSEFLAPFDNEEYEIWVLGNRLNRFLDKGLRVTRIFEIHDDLSEHGDINKYCDWLKSHKIPLVIGENSPLSEGYVYPFKDIEKLYGSLYLTSSPAYMMGLAILEGAEEIQIYGVDLTVDDHEYFWQRPCMEAWVGFAKGLGIKVVIPDVSPLGKSDYVEGRLSGGRPDFSKPPFTERSFKELASKHQTVIDEANQKINELKNLIVAHSTAYEVNDRLAKVARAVEAGVNINDLSEVTSIKR